MDEKVLDSVDMTAKNEDRALDIAMFHFGRFASAERRKKELEEKEKKKEDELRRMRREKRRAEKLLEDTENELAVIRKFAGLTRENSNIRKQYSVKAFFDLVSLLDTPGTRDITDAYNFVGDTEWLASALKQAISMPDDGSKIVIDAVALRKAIVEKKKSIEEVIADAKRVLEKEWEHREEENAKKKTDAGKKVSVDNLAEKVDAGSAKKGKYKAVAQGSYKPAEHSA